MRILFFEPDFTGHHFAYLGRMLPGFVDLPVQILLATTQSAIDSNEFAKSLSLFGSRLESIPCCTPASRGPIANARHRLRELSRSIGDVKPDHVMVSYADGLWDQAYLSSVAGIPTWPPELVVEGCIYRGRFADPDDRRWKSRLRRRMFVGMLRRGLFRRLHLHHELLFKFAEAPAVGTRTSIVLAPDPIVIRPLMTTIEARRELGISDGENEKWIGLIGVIAKYKGAHLFLDGYRIRRERGDEQPLRALLAGPIESDIRRMLDEDPFRRWIADGSLVLIDRFLTEREMFAAAAAVDLVVAPYPNHQNRSSIILWAAAAGRPSLGPDESCVDYVIRQERLGTSCHVQNPTILADAISAALSTEWTVADVARVRAYAEFHRIDNYQATSSQLLRERLGV
jgi:glycosyltransferase involved in cell wall biosynthesis